MSDFAAFGILAIAIGSAAIGAGRKILERRRARRELRTRPALAAGSPEGDVVRVTGVVQLVDDQTLEAPLSGLSCVVVRSRVRPTRTPMDRARPPKETIAMVPFIIDRGEAGRVLVEGKHVLLDLPPLRMKRSSIEQRRREQFLIAHGFPLREVGRADFEETVVEAGARVSVAGLMMKDLPSEPVPDELGFRDATPPNLRIAGNVEHPLVIGVPVD